MINEREKMKIYELEKRSVNAKEEIARELELIRILLETLIRRQNYGRLDEDRN